MNRIDLSCSALGEIADTSQINGVLLTKCYRQIEIIDLLP